MVDDLPKPIATSSILVAETETTSRISLSELLRERGYTVVEAADSGSAITQIGRSIGPNIILADLEMPAWRTLILHARDRLRSSFILGMVRYGGLANGLEAQTLGADGYLVKPLRFEDVDGWIQRFLTGQTRLKS